MAQEVCEDMTLCINPADGPIPKPTKAPKSKGKSIRRVSAKRVAYRKSDEGKAGLAHMAQVRKLPCVICWAHGERQESPTTVHHCICGRYSNHKAPDTSVIPLCSGHHQGDFDTSKLSIHRDRSEWVAQYGQDTEYLPVVADMLAGEANT